MLKIRRSCDCLIFNMEIPIPGKDGLYIKTWLRGLNVNVFFVTFSSIPCLYLDPELAAVFVATHRPGSCPYQNSWRTVIRMNIEWYNAFSISRGHLPPTNSQKTSHSSLVRVSYGCLLCVKQKSRFLAAGIYSISCCIWQRYIESLLYNKYAVIGLYQIIKRLKPVYFVI